MLMRVRRAFAYHGVRGDIKHAQAGSIINVTLKTDDQRLRSQGFITDVELPRSGGPLVDPAQSYKRTFRVGIWMVTSSGYSGGRVHMYQYAWTMAKAGAEVFLITNRHPLWAQDYPHLPNLKIVTAGPRCAPEDIDLIITDSKGDVGHQALAYKREHPRIPLVCLNLETPNWIVQFVPAHEKKLPLDKSVFLQANHLLANSNESRKWLLKWLGKGAAECTVLHPAVNTFAVGSKKPVGEVMGKRPFAVWSARSESYKGGKTAVEAVWELKVPFDLVMFGAPPRLPQPSKLHTVIPLRGRSDAEKFSVMQRAKFVLAPSLFEGFGMVPVEAMSVGTPVVAYALPVFQQEFAGLKGLITVPHGDAKAFKKKVAEMAAKPKIQVDAKPVHKKFGMAAMAKTVPKIPKHDIHRKEITAHMVGFWGVFAEALEAVYKYVDQILIAFGPTPHAQLLNDGSWDRIRNFPDPDKKIQIEKRSSWTNKREMRQWCADRARGNWMLELDGDEVWVGLGEWIKQEVAFGTPRWVNFWHSGGHWIYDGEGKSTAPRGRRWGDPLQPFGSVCPHYRWSWWRPSYYFHRHNTPVDAACHPLYMLDNKPAAARSPRTTIYHMGHCLPAETMKAKHDFYCRRDGDDEGRQKRRKAWHTWGGKMGNCGDGTVAKVDWKLPDIVKQAAESAKAMVPR